MGLFNLFWDLRQDDRIRAAETQAGHTQFGMQDIQRQLVELRAAIDRVALTNQAMWELVRERTELTDADLQAKVDDVDRRDGTADDRMAQPAVTCPRCRRPNAVARARCLYCGSQIAARPDVRQP